MSTEAPSEAPAQPVSRDGVVRFDWNVDEARALHQLPLFELIDRARAVHLREHPKDEVQLCTLLSVKTGGCPENCSYCPAVVPSSRRQGGEDAQGRSGA